MRWTFTEVQQYFASHIALKRVESSQTSDRKVNHTNTGKRKFNSKPKGGKERKGRKVQRDSSAPSSKKPTGNNGNYQAPTHVWKSLSDVAKQEIIDANRAARNAKAASSTDRKDTINDSEMVNNYDVVPLSQSSTRLVGTKVAKRTPGKFRVSAATHRESEQQMDEPNQLTKSGSEKSNVKPINTPKSDIP